MNLKPTVENLLIIGNGMASDRLLECLSAEDHNFSIRVIGEEPEYAYNRILLSSVLAGEKPAENIQLKTSDWYRSRNIEMIYGDPVTELNLEQTKVTTKSGSHFDFDKVVFATGSRASLPNIPGSNSDAVRCFRNMRDITFLLQAVKNISKVAIVGGGLLGLEAAHGMNLAGVDVHLIHRQEHLMNRQLDFRAGQLLQKQLEERGIHFYMSRQPEAVENDSNTYLILDKGERVEAELVIFAAGITPNKELAEASGITCNRAILVDEQLRTSSENVYAIGECTEHQGKTLGLVAPVNEQARVLAENLLGNSSSYKYRETSTVLKVSGIEMFSAGEFDSTKTLESQCLQIEDPEFGLYRHLSFTNHKLTGAILLGDKRGSSWYEQLIENQQDISKLMPEIIFGRDYCQEKPDQSKSNPQAVEVI